MKYDDAVSPVVGVMLMLVVTIIIAAVVSAFAGGFGGNTQSAPSASIDVSAYKAVDDTMGGTKSVIVFELLSGEPIRTNDLSIVTYYEIDTGTTVKHTQRKGDGCLVTAPSSGKTAVPPMLSDAATYGYAGNNPSVDFGNYTWMTGDILTTRNINATAFFLGFDEAGVPGSEYDDEFDVGDVIDIKIIHVPSGQTIFDREVVVK